MLESSIEFDPTSVNLVPMSFPASSIRDKLLSAGGGRVDRAEVRKRAGNAMLRGLPTMMDCTNDAKEWAIIGGGPSINDCLPHIRSLKRRGVNIVSVNKSHDWLLDHGITPWGHVLLDPKEWVADYVKRPRRDVRYFVASQCHDDTFDALDGYPVFLWHAGQDFPEGDEPNTYLKQKWPKAPWFVVPGATTVGLRAVQLGHCMGADRFHLFGMDSSRAAGKLHGYEKPEAPDSCDLPLKLKHRGLKYKFDTNDHMARQQMDFDDLIEKLPSHFASGLLRKDFSLTVYGSGLLPFFAAMCGLHADPECNADPSKVGGYVSTDLMDFAALVA